MQLRAIEVKFVVSHLIDLSSTPKSVDGRIVEVGDLILVRSQKVLSENAVYKVEALDLWLKTTVKNGLAVWVDSGNNFSSSIFILTHTTNFRFFGRGHKKYCKFSEEDYPKTESKDNER